MHVQNKISQNIKKWYYFNYIAKYQKTSRDGTNVLLIMFIIKK